MKDPKLGKKMGRLKKNRGLRSQNSAVWGEGTVIRKSGMGTNVFRAFKAV